MTKVKLYYEEGPTEIVDLSYEQYRKMFSEGKYADKQLTRIEVLYKDSDKGPNTIRFT